MSAKHAALWLVLLMVAGAAGQTQPSELPPFELTRPDDLRMPSTGTGEPLPPPPPPTEAELLAQRRGAEAGGMDLDAVSDRTDEAFYRTRVRSRSERILLSVVIVGASLSVFILVILLRLRRRL